MILSDYSQAVDWATFSSGGSSEKISTSQLIHVVSIIHFLAVYMRIWLLIVIAWRLLSDIRGCLATSAMLFLHRQFTTWLFASSRLTEKVSLQSAHAESYII